MNRASTAEAGIAAIAADVGIHVHMHARVIGVDGVTAAEDVGVNCEDRVPIASLYKLPLASAWADLAEHGHLDARGRLTIAHTTRTVGETGIACLGDDVELSQRDAVRLMLSVSDNASAEAILDLVGLDRLRTWLADQGLHRTSIVQGSAQSLRRVIEETGGRTLAEAMAALADPHFDRGTSEYDSALTSVSSARDLTALLELIWNERPYAWVLDSMRQQVWRHRIGSGFPHDDVDVAGKTGTLGRLRHEAAIVRFLGERPIAVAVMTTSIRPEIHQPRVDAAIGTIARVAAQALRAPA